AGVADGMAMTRCPLDRRQASSPVWDSFGTKRVSRPSISRIAFETIGLAASILLVAVSCASPRMRKLAPVGPSPAPPTLPGTRTAWVGSLSSGCVSEDLELVIPFYEGLRLKP